MKNEELWCRSQPSAGAAVNIDKNVREADFRNYSLFIIHYSF